MKLPLSIATKGVLLEPKNGLYHPCRLTQCDFVEADYWSSVRSWRQERQIMVLQNSQLQHQMHQMQQMHEQGGSVPVHVQQSLQQLVGRCRLTPGFCSETPRLLSSVETIM